MEKTTRLTEADSVRKECKKLLVDLDLDKPGIVPALARELSSNGDIVNPKSLNMALTGYRNGKRSLELLLHLRRTLAAKYSKQVSGSY